MEIQERHDAVKEMEKNLRELHQVFMDMAVLVQSQGEQLNDIESHVNRANPFVRGGTQQLEVARKHQKNIRKIILAGRQGRGGVGWGENFFELEKNTNLNKIKLFRIYLYFCKD
ncbi:Syntaxin [Abeliophyllum distichum]|uniref:Syntaxin n=1 Tax=Abeliophyllum distichum TaxID=126358 RepID=A0ABD1VE67_9LAMI